MSEPETRADGTDEQTESASLIDTHVTADSETDTTGVHGESVVEARELDVHYGEEQALRDVHLDIYEREVTAIIGPSGCGKSTFLRCINRMNDLVESARIDGQLRFRGTDMYSDEIDPVALRRQIGMVFQHPNPFQRASTTTSPTDCGCKTRR
jgi:phosphate ABC transporter ATP-binding protein, PhoT family (TC 3.A.1.7.1)